MCNSHSTSTSKSGSAKPATTRVVLLGLPSGGKRAKRAPRTLGKFRGPTLTTTVPRNPLDSSEILQMGDLLISIIAHMLRQELKVFGKAVWIH